MPSICGNFIRFVQLSLHVFSELTFLGQLKLGIFISNYRKMFLLQIQLCWVRYDVLCILDLFHDLCFLYKFLLIYSCISDLCVIAIACVIFVHYRMLNHSIFMTSFHAQL